MTTIDMSVDLLQETLKQLRALPASASREQAINRVEQQIQLVQQGGGSMAAPLGSGARFKALSSKLAARGDVADPDALAATIGRKKHGKAAMARMAAAGRKKKSPDQY